MRVNFGPLRFFPFVLMIAGALIVTTGSVAAQPELVVEVLDMTVSSTDGEGMLTIKLDNNVDTVAGFAMWLMLDRPDVITFQLDVTTVVDTSYWQCLTWSGPDCVESLLVSPYDSWDWFTIDTNEISAAAFDTTGTLTSGWQWVDARSISGMGTDVNVAGIANMISPPTVPGIYPQQGGSLIKIPFDILADPVDPEGEIVNVIIVYPPMDHFSFSDPWGNTIGLTYDTIPDTSCFICTQWAGEECLNWQRIPMGTEDCDSILIEDIVVVSLDTSLVVILDGTVTVLPGCLPIIPGDLDGDGFSDISELAMLVEYIHFGSPPIPCPWNADVNGDCVINWDDANLLEEGGPYVECTCVDPQWVCCRDLAGNFDYDRFDDVNVADLTKLVAYMFTGGAPPYCYEEADIDSAGDPPGINVSDLTSLVAYLFTGGDAPTPCSIGE
ncbi:MAG: hypothetical protein KOO62_01090 [candidate division Zixibacteria bacterium]|nr:hypothetical protein [candidate division Zixibacteria bacterium]